MMSVQSIRAVALWLWSHVLPVSLVFGFYFGLALAVGARPPMAWAVAFIAAILYAAVAALIDASREEPAATPRRPSE